MKNLKITKAIFIALMVLIFMVIPFSSVKATDIGVARMATESEETDPVVDPEEDPEKNPEEATPSEETENPEEATPSEETGTESGTPSADNSKEVKLDWDFEDGEAECENLPTSLPKGAKMALSDIKVNAPEGKSLAGFEINGVTYKVTDVITVAENMTIKAVYEDAKEEKNIILDGADQTYVVGSSKEFSVRASGALETCLGIEVDKVAVPEKYLTLKSGSTIAILSNEYLDTLSEGVHDLTFKYASGDVTTQFTIAKANAVVTENGGTTETATTEETKTEETTKKNPTTGDAIAVWVAVLGLATVVTVVSAKLKRNK